MAKKQAKTGTFLEVIGGINVDKIGGNSLLIEHIDEKGNTTRIMTDLGRMFPPYTTDFEMALPDVTEYFDRNDPKTKEYTKALKPVDAIFITHAHEDHIGALIDYTKMGYVLPTIYGSRYTCNRIRVGFKHEGMKTPMMIPIKHQAEEKQGNDISVEALKVSHSILGSMGYMEQIRSANGDEINVLNTGDFFTEENMPIGDSYSREDFRDLLRRKPPTYYLVDSTAVSSKGAKRLSFEELVENRLNVIMKNSDRTVIVSPVISNANPNIAIDCEVARRLGTKIFLDGKGLTLMHEAMLMSDMKDFEDVLYKGKIGQFMADKNIKIKYIVNTGGLAQGLREYDNNQALGQIIPLSSAVKIALGLHDYVKANQDMLLLSCQGIIGDINGDTGPKMLQLYASQGVKVYMTPRDKKVANFEEVVMQNPGHILFEELKAVFSDIKEFAPNCIVVPIHGNPEQCEAVKILAEQSGLRTHMSENTDYINLETGRGQPSKKKKVFNWIGIKSIYPDPLHRDDSIPPEGKKEFWRIDKYFQEIEKIGEVNNVRVYEPGSKGFYHIQGAEYLETEYPSGKIPMNQKYQGNHFNRQEKGDKKTRAERDAEKKEELKMKKEQKKAKEQARLLKKLGKSILD